MTVNRQTLRFDQSVEMCEGVGKRRAEDETFPTHLALLMIFSANSLPVDLDKKEKQSN